MKHAISIVSAITVTLVVGSQAHADAGDVAAGLLGGLAAGAIIGGAVAAPPPIYVGPAPVYVAPAPVPVYVEPTCYWTRGRPVWDGYRWIRSRIQVCD
jgi:hypothetical protein